MYASFDRQVSKLDAMDPREPERREMLATLLYVLQDAPEALLREMWKDVRNTWQAACLGVGLGPFFTLVFFSIARARLSSCGHGCYFGCCCRFGWVLVTAVSVVVVHVYMYQPLLELRQHPTAVPLYPLRGGT